MSEGEPIKIVSWNLLHRDGATLDDVIALIAGERPDVLLMQEVTARIDPLAERIGGGYSRHPLPGRRHGLAIWTSPRLSHSPEILLLEPGIVVQRICQVIDLGAFAIANVHLSHGQLLNRRQLRAIARQLPPRAAIMGDCNMVGAAMLRGFRDIGPGQATHRAGGAVSLRLDRCLTRGLACEDARLLPQGASDHHPIAVRLAVKH